MLPVRGLHSHQGAKRGANGGRYWAMPGHCQPLSAQLNGTSGDTEQHRATCQECLLSSRSQVRILLGALCSGRSGLQYGCPAGQAQLLPRLVTNYLDAKSRLAAKPNCLEKTEAVGLAFDRVGSVGSSMK